MPERLDCQSALGPCRMARGQITLAHPVNVEAHNRNTASRKAMQHSFMTPEDHDGTAIRTFYPQDQASKPPRIALAAYAGTPLSQITPRLAGLTRPIRDRDGLRVAEKAWDCGHRIQARHAPSGVALRTPVKASPKRQAEGDAVPLEK